MSANGDALTGIEQILYEIWDEIPSLLIEVRPNGVIVHINQAFTRALGWDQRDLAGHTWDAFIHPDDLRKTQNDRRKIGEKAPEVRNYVVRWLNTGNVYVPISWYHPNYDGASERIYAVGRITGDGFTP